MVNRLFGKGKPPVWLLAALPPLLLGLALSLFLVSMIPLSNVVWGGSTPLRVLADDPALLPLVMSALLGVVLVGGALVGAWRRLPPWSHTWTTTAVVVVSFALMMLSDDRANLISPLADTITALALFALLVALALLAAWRSWTEAALVGMGFAAAFALAVIFTAVAGPMLRIDVALLTAPTGLAFAVQVAAFARGGRAVRWLAVGLTALLAMALIWQYKVVVFAALGSPYDLRFFRVLASIAMVGLASPPLLAWLAGRRRQLPPRVS